MLCSSKNCRPVPLLRSLGRSRQDRLPHFLEVEGGSRCFWDFSHEDDFYGSEKGDLFGFYKSTGS